MVALSGAIVFVMNSSSASKWPGVGRFGNDAIQGTVPEPFGPAPARANGPASGIRAGVEIRTTPVHEGHARLGPSQVNRLLEEQGSRPVDWQLT